MSFARIEHIVTQRIANAIEAITVYEAKIRMTHDSIDQDTRFDNDLEAKNLSPYCRGCALLRKKFKEDLFTYCVENGIFQYLQDTSESSNNNTNVVNAPQEPFVVKQDPGENSLQSPPHIDHNCCYECGDSLDGIFCQRCTCKSCGKGAHHGYNCPPKVPIISNPRPCNNQTIDELPQTLPRFDPTCYSERENSLPYVSKPNFVDDSPNVFNPPPQPPTYSYEFCGNDAYYGYDCPPQVPFIYPEPCYNQDFNFPQNFHNFQQQYLCCENCGGPHETFQCQPMNQSYYEPNPCYDSNSFGFDQFQPPQYTVNHPIFNAQNELFNSQNKLMEQLTSVCDMVGQYIQKKEEEKRIEEEQAAKARYWKIPVCYDDDDDEERSIPLKDTIISGLPPCVAITPALSTEEPVDSLIMENEHLDTIPETESDEFIKSSVENLERIAKEKEAEELEAERKKKECLKIENSLPKASTRSRRSRIDPSLKGFKVFPEESVSSLKMGDEHLNTQKDSRESSVKYPIPTPRELDVIPDEYYDEGYQKRFDELVKDFLSPTSIYDNISIGYLGTIEIKEIDTPITPDIPLREETPRYFYDGSMDNGEDIIPLMRISKETGLPEKIIDKSLSESFVSRMNVCQPIPITPDVPILETVNSLKMGEVHFDTSKDSFESSVRDSFSIPRESNDLSNGVIEDFQNELNNEKNSNSETIADVPIKDSLLMVDEQINTTPSTESDEIKKSSVEILNPIPRESNDAKECEISIKGNSMEAKVKSFENVLFEQNEEFSSYDESSSKVENKFDTFKCFSNPLFELDEEIITLEKDVFQNEVISNQEKINDTCETERDLKFFDDLLNENTLPPDVFNVENDFQDNKEEIDISCDMIPPGIDTVL
ncbi:hypothetical protein Tco_1111092 [Tanacetum coccineum]|uniref:Uncharacterized protein n=1 Tax=Tanacetum coccineum TaxID=301880 RepID=A0ABQ5IKX4_9ASTR